MNFNTLVLKINADGNATIVVQTPLDDTGSNGGRQWRVASSGTAAAERQKQCCNEFSRKYPQISLPLEAKTLPWANFRTFIRLGLPPMGAVAASEAEFWILTCR